MWWIRQYYELTSLQPKPQPYFGPPLIHSHGLFATLTHNQKAAAFRHEHVTRQGAQIPGLICESSAWNLRAGIAQSVQRLATGWTIRGSNPGAGRIFRIRPDRPWSPHRLLHKGYRVCSPGVKWPGRGFDHLPTSSAVVKERVELYLSKLSWPVLRAKFSFLSVWNLFHVTLLARGVL